MLAKNMKEIKMIKRYLLSVLYALLVFILWTFGAAALGSASMGFGASGTIIGLFSPYYIANVAEKKGYSWLKHFLIFGFFAGIPMIGIIKSIQIKIKKVPENTANHDAAAATAQNEHANEKK